MLILERREGESIKLGDNIEIKVTHADGKREKIGIKAPREIPIERLNIQEETNI